MMSSLGLSESRPYCCPFCGYHDFEIYTIQLHIESFHTPDSPFIVEEEKCKVQGAFEDENGYVLCPEELCGEPVLRSDLQTHLDMHLAERVALTELGDANSTLIPTGHSLSHHAHSSKSSSPPKDKKKSQKGNKGKLLVYREPITPRGSASTPSTSRSKRKAKRLGTSELGPYAMEQRMPPELYKQLAEGPPISHHMQFGPNGTLIRVATIANETPNLVPVIAKLCSKDPNIAYAWLCHDAVRHISKQLPREGGFCGYRNIQMMISYIQGAFAEETHPFPGMIPTIIKLQDWIEAGWEMGINEHGKVETGGIKGTRKYIGTSEAETLFVSLGVICGAKYLAGGDDVTAHEALYNFVEAYYEKGRPNGNTDRILQTQMPPIYLQHSGHSMTIIGLEVYRDGSRSLLVFDPSFSPSPGIRDLVGAKRISSKIDVAPLMKLHRRGTPYLAKYKEFELLTVQPNPKQTHMLDGFHTKPYLLTRHKFGWPLGKR